MFKNTLVKNIFVLLSYSLFYFITLFSITNKKARISCSIILGFLTGLMNEMYRYLGKITSMMEKRIK